MSERTSAFESQNLELTVGRRNMVNAERLSKINAQVVRVKLAAGWKHLWWLLWCVYSPGFWRT